MKKDEALASLRAFATDIMEDFSLGDLDGGSRQDIAVKHGILAPVTVSEPCREGCECAGYGEDFPMECFRLTPLVTGTEDDQPREGYIDVHERESLWLAMLRNEHNATLPQAMFNMIVARLATAQWKDPNA